jgi:hypothetical protein
MPSVIDLSVPAAGDLSALQYHIVKLNSSGQAAACLDGEAGFGILQNKPAAAGRGASVRTEGESFVVAGAAITAGDELASNGSSRAHLATSGDEVVAQALQTATGDGSIIRCSLKRRGGAAS